MAVLDRILSITGPQPAPENVWRENLLWFRRFLFMHVAVRSYLTINPNPSASIAEGSLHVAVLWVALMGLLLPTSMWTTRLTSALLVAELIISIPFTANHVFLELLFLALLSLLDPRDTQEGELLLKATRWLIVIVLFYTGLQKLLYGYYFQGQFLAFVAATEDRFALLFQFVVPSEELERLRSYNQLELTPGVFQPRVGAGPYRIDSVWFLLLSNGVYVFEMVVPVLLLLYRTRTAAAVASMLFVGAIQAGARELTFGAMMCCALMLFLPRPWIKFAFPLYLGFYVYLVAHESGIVPMFEYSPA